MRYEGGLLISFALPSSPAQLSNFSTHRVFKTTEQTSSFIGTVMEAEINMLKEDLENSIPTLKCHWHPKKVLSCQPPALEGGDLASWFFVARLNLDYYPNMPEVLRYKTCLGISTSQGTGSLSLTEDAPLWSASPKKLRRFFSLKTPQR